MKKIKQKIIEMKKDKKIYKDYIETLYDIPKVKEEYKKNEDFKEMKKYVEKEKKY